MRMCRPHWDALRQGVKDRGIWHLVASNGAEAAENMQRELAGDQDAAFDPLMAANWSLFSAAIECGGLEMMVGEHCPLCEADAHGGLAAEWLDGCLDAQLAHARALGLVPGVQ